MMTSTKIPTIKPVKVVQHMLVISATSERLKLIAIETTFKKISFHFFLSVHFISLDFNKYSRGVWYRVGAVFNRTSTAKHSEFLN